MIFDKSKVYTALNADELKVGSEVILANYLESLKNQVEANSWPTYTKKLKGIMGTASTNRFKAGDQTYNLAYFVSEPEEKVCRRCVVYLWRMENGYCELTIGYDNDDEWGWIQKNRNAKTKLFVGSESQCVEWRNARRKFTDIIKAWEDGKAVLYYDADENDWFNVDFPKWNVNCQYRIKPKENVLKWTDLKVKDVIKKDNDTRLIIDVDGNKSNHNNYTHINAGGYWMTDEELESWEKEE